MVEKVACGVDVRFENVDTIERSSGLRVRAGGDWMNADHVILACPAWSAAQMLLGAEPALAQRLNQIPYSSSLTLSLIYDAAKFDGRRAGFGFLVPRRERKRVGAGTFVGTKFPFRAPDNRIIVRLFFGGVNDEAILGETDERILTIAREELSSILGLTTAPMFHTISRWPRAMAQYTVGHGKRMQEIKDRAGAIPGLHLAGNAYEGIGIPDCVRTGRAAANKIIGS